MFRISPRTPRAGSVRIVGWASRRGPVGGVPRGARQSADRRRRARQQNGRVSAEPGEHGALHRAQRHAHDGLPGALHDGGDVPEQRRLPIVELGERCRRPRAAGSESRPPLWSPAPGGRSCPGRPLLGLPMSARVMHASTASLAGDQLDDALGHAVRHGGHEVDGVAVGSRTAAAARRRPRARPAAVRRAAGRSPPGRRPSARPSRRPGSPRPRGARRAAAGRPAGWRRRAPRRGRWW